MTTDPFPCPQPDCALMCDGACIARARRLDDEDDEPAVPLAQGGIVSPDAQPLADDPQTQRVIALADEVADFLAERIIAAIEPSYADGYERGRQAGKAEGITEAAAEIAAACREAARAAWTKSHFTGLTAAAKIAENYAGASDAH